MFPQEENPMVFSSDFYYIGPYASPNEGK